MGGKSHAEGKEIGGITTTLGLSFDAPWIQVHRSLGGHDISIVVEKTGISFSRVHGGAGL